MPSLLRSFLAVMAGFIVMSLAVFLLLIVAVNLMHRQPRGHLLVDVLCALVASVIGGFVTARFAPRHPFRHAAVLAGVMLIMGAISFVHPDAAAQQQATGFRILMTLLPPACALAGAALFLRIHKLRHPA